MNIVAIIQASMGSSRLPGKVLMDVDGKTMLERVYDRVQLSRHVNKIVVAAPDHLHDEPIWQLCNKKGWATTFRDENDVLGQYWAAATHYRADKVVRITADNPLVDPESLTESSPPAPPTQRSITFATFTRYERTRKGWT